MGKPGDSWVGLGVLKCQSNATHVANDADHGNEAVRSVRGTPLGVDRPWREASHMQTRNLPLHEATSEIPRGCACQIESHTCQSRKACEKSKTSISNAPPLNRERDYALTHQQCKPYYGRDKLEILLTQVPENVHRLRQAMKPGAKELVLKIRPAKRWVDSYASSVFETMGITYEGQPPDKNKWDDDLKMLVCTVSGDTLAKLQLGQLPASWDLPEKLRAQVPADRKTPPPEVPPVFLNRPTRSRSNPAQLGKTRIGV